MSIQHHNCDVILLFAFNSVVPTLSKNKKTFLHFANPITFVIQSRFLNVWDGHLLDAVLTLFCLLRL